MLAHRDGYFLRGKQRIASAPAMRSLLVFSRLEAFEAAGYKNAFRVELMPEGTDLGRPLQRDSVDSSVRPNLLMAVTSGNREV
jgi:hypothetical protein